MNRPRGPSRVPRSLELFERAQARIPGGAQLISRRPSRFAWGVSPIYAARAQGARMWDVDGHEYIDWTSGIGAILLGYADPVVDDAVREQLSRGTIYGINHELEIEVADELAAMIPCAEMVRYTKGGGEACALAVRIARGVTGRSKILFCGYHGWHDWYLAANLAGETTLDAHLFPGIEPVGVPRELRHTALPFPYGDLGALSRLLDQHGRDVAAVMLEPLRSEMPPPGYLAQVADLARQAGSVLIFDEVSSGLRLGLHAAQGFVGVTPDLAVFAKSLSNGYPLGAVVGRRAVMEPAGQMFLSSTYWSDTLGLRAALTTLREVRRRDVPTQLWRFGELLQTALNRAAAATGFAVRCEGLAVHPQLRFQTNDPQQQRLLSTLYIQEMAKRGCHGYAAFYLNAAQGEGELQQTEAAARETFQLLADANTAGHLHELLEADLQQDAFRRLVR